MIVAGEFGEGVVESGQAYEGENEGQYVQYGVEEELEGARETRKRGSQAGGVREGGKVQLLNEQPMLNAVCWSGF